MPKPTKQSASNNSEASLHHVHERSLPFFKSQAKADEEAMLDLEYKLRSGQISINPERKQLSDIKATFYYKRQAEKSWHQHHHERREQVDNKPDQKLSEQQNSYPPDSL